MTQTSSPAHSPAHCDMCHAFLPNVYYDAKTRMGPWANMCPACFRCLGIGLGTGLGQKYVLHGSPHPTWVQESPQKRDSQQIIESIRAVNPPINEPPI